MTEPVSLSDLVVVGYADALPATMRPVRLPPVFRWRDSPDRYLLPPFHLNAGVVYNGTEVHGTEVARLVEEERVTLSEGDGWLARPDHELWMDLEGRVHYQSRVQVDQALNEIYCLHLERAKQEFREQCWDEAERQCGICILADERKLDPYIVKAAILQRQGRPRGVERLRKLAGRFTTPENFDRYVASLLRETMPVDRPMYRMAACPPCFV